MPDERYTILAELAMAVADAEMRARLYDLLWVRPNSIVVELMSSRSGA